MKGIKMREAIFIFGLCGVALQVVFSFLLERFSTPMMSIFVLADIVLIVSTFWYGISYSIEEQKRNQARINRMKQDYDDALCLLEKRPANPKSRLNCLDVGRVYYEATMPDTMTVHYNNGIPVGTSGHQNNSVGREARINSDIEARIGHLKFGKASEVIRMETDTIDRISGTQIPPKWTLKTGT
jgi:hypothetical protein